MLRHFLGLALAISVVACATTQTAPTADARPPGSLLFGIATYSGSQVGEADAKALGAALSKRVGQPVVVLAFSDETSLANALATNGVDAAWMPPLAFSEARSRADISPLTKLIRHGKGYYRGALFARADRGIATLKDLDGKKIAWVDRRSAAGYTFPRALLSQAHLKPDTLFSQELFVGDHAAVCHAVLDGKVDVGATFVDDRPEGMPSLVDGCAQSVGPEEATKLIVIATSKPIPNDVIAVRAGLAPEASAALKSGLQSLARDEDGKSILATVFRADGFMDSSMSDFGF
jgi:phosphonate transport system substrate-binding protein